jgi:hypothetical protein
LSRGLRRNDASEVTDGAPDPRRDEGIATFVIRIRPEGAGEDEGGWVAHVTNVLEQSERYARGLDDLMRFIEEYLERTGMASRRVIEPEKRQRERG